MKSRWKSSTIISSSGESVPASGCGARADTGGRDADVRKQKETETSLSKMMSAFKQVRFALPDIAWC